MVKSADEAREILSDVRVDSFGSPTERVMEFYWAQGYLSGMEDPAVKALVEALEKIEKDGDIKSFSEVGYYRGFEAALFKQSGIAIKALATYRTAIKGRQGE